MTYLVSDTGVAIISADDEEDCVTLQCVGKLFYIDAFSNVTEAKKGVNPVATYVLDADDVIKSLQKMGLI
jgi:hypothetical protein